MIAAALERELADLMADGRDADRRVAEADLASIPAELAELSRRLVALDRRLLAASKRMRVTNDTDLTRLAATELDRLHALHGVSAITINREHRQLVVETNDVVVEWTGQRFRLGRYLLMIALEGDVRIESLDHLGPKRHWDHPHVQGGLPCLGNLREGVLKLIAECELALAVQVLLDFLTTYDPESAYTPIEGWSP